jgi:hypothetical protein
LYQEELGGRLPELATRDLPLVPPVVKVTRVKKYTSFDGSRRVR